MQKQQGDVTFETVGTLPTGAVKVKAKPRGFILAEGEATGHAHCIAETDSAICELYEKDGILYVKVVKPIPVTHEEHKPVELEPEIWKIGRVNEFDYAKNMTKKVVD